MEQLKFWLIWLPRYIRKYLTQKDLEEIIEFYESPVGKKLAVSTPHITSEIMTEGQKWGAKLNEMISTKISEQK